MRVEWHPLARSDLAELVGYIAAADPSAASRVLENIEQQIGMLGRYPQMGRSGRVRGTRELVITGTPYIAAYRVIRDVVTVLRLLHGARRWPRRL